MLAVTVCLLAACGASVGVAAASADEVAYATNEGDGTVTPIDVTTGTAGASFDVGSTPAAIAITPDGSTLLVANNTANTVTPVLISSGASGLTYTPGTPISAGPGPDAIAVTTDGSTAYVTNDGSDTVTPITLDGINIAGDPLPVHPGPDAIALTPNGELAYVTSDSGWVTAIVTATNGISTQPPAIRVGANPDAIAIAPNGETGYVTDSTSGSLTQFAIPSDEVGAQINVGATPNAIAITPNGNTAWVADNIGTTSSPLYALTPIALPSGTAGASILLPAQPSAITISADGSTAYVTEYSTDEVVPVDLTAGVAGAAIPVGSEPSAIALTPASSSGSTAPGQYTFPVTGQQTGTIGDQTLTLTYSGKTTSPTAVCLRPTGTVTSRLTVKFRRHGRFTVLARATITLGKTTKRIKRIPATVKLPLRGLKPGTHTITATLIYLQRIDNSRLKEATKTLRTKIKIC
jgi:DNA-binding beta-propeller fold protein YncE